MHSHILTHYLHVALDLIRKAYIDVALVINILQRSDIVIGSYEPTDKECEWNLDDADDDGAVSPKIVEIKEDGESAISGLTVC